MMEQNEVIENATQKRRNKKMTSTIAPQQLSILMAWVWKCSDVPGVDWRVDRHSQQHTAGLLEKLLATLLFMERKSSPSCSQKSAIKPYAEVVQCNKH
jgi:hypothetical protein